MAIQPRWGILAFWLFWVVPVSVSAAGFTGKFYLNTDHILTDQAGRRIPIEKPFSRIISLYGAHTENLFYLGLDQEIIGVAREDHYPSQASEKPVFSYHDDPEKFLAARPDLVLIRPMIDRGYGQLMQRLEQSGIVVVSLQPKTIEQMYRYWLILGVLSGKRQGAQQMVGRFRRAVTEFQALAATVTHKPRVYFEAIHKHMKTFTRGAMADFVLTAAGGINVAADGIPSRGTNIAIYGKEKILSRANEIDVYLAQQGAMNHPTRAMIQNEPGFSIIKAVKNNAIYIVREELVSRPTMRLLYGIHDVGNILYPGRNVVQRRQILQRALNP